MSRQPSRLKSHRLMPPETICVFSGSVQLSWNCFALIPRSAATSCIKNFGASANLPLGDRERLGARPLAFRSSSVGRGRRYRR